MLLVSPLPALEVSGEEEVIVLEGVIEVCREHASTSLATFTPV